MQTEWLEPRLIAPTSNERLASRMAWRGRSRLNFKAFLLTYWRIVREVSPPSARCTAGVAVASWPRALTGLCMRGERGRAADDPEGVGL